MRRDIKSSFDLAARYYRYRLPYTTGFFKGTHEFLGMGDDTSLLDICCGDGRLAAGFAALGARVTGIDFSQTMLARAARHPRIAYHLHDFNGRPPLPETLRHEVFSHLMIGSAIQWVETQSLGAVARDNLADGGCILICGSILEPTTPWRDAFRAIKNEFSFKETRQDLTGRKKLAKIGFEFDKELSAGFQTQFTLEALARHAMSFGRAAAPIHHGLADFMAQLGEAMAPYMDGDGMLHADTAAWGLVYRRHAEPAAG